METKINKLMMLSWLIMPLIVVWVSVNYLIGAINKPQWNEDNQIVLGATNEANNDGEMLERWKWDGDGIVTLWFDDAWISQYKIGFPILEEKEMKGALAVPTESIGFDAYMNWTQVKRLQFAGWEITSHSKTHDCNIPGLSSSEIELEILGSKRTLEQRGIETNIYVAPCGTNSPETTEIIKKYYAAARNVEPGLNPLPLQNYYDIKVVAVEKDTSIDTIKQYMTNAGENNQWLILMFHEISDDTSQFGSNEELFRQVIEEVDKSNLEVVLPSQVINYIQ